MLEEESLEYVLWVLNYCIEKDLWYEINPENAKILKEYLSRINKAIEFIETFNKTIKNDKRFGGDVDFMTIPKDLLKILEGSDKE